MAKTLKWLLYTVGALLLLLVVTVVAIVLLVDPNQFRDEIAAEVQKRTGRELVIEGDIELSVFPWLGLELGRTRLSDAPGFGDQPFLSLERAALAVELLPLLEKRLVLDTVEFEGVQVRLRRNPDGRANWEELTERLAGDKAAAEPEPPAQPEKEAGGPPVTLDRLGGLKLSNAVVIYDDRQAGVRYELNPLSVDIDEPALGKPSPVQAQWTVRGSNLPELVGQLGAQVLLDQNLERLEVDDLKLDLTARGETVPGGSQQVQLLGQLQGNLKTGQYRIPQLTVQAAGLNVRTSGELVLAEAGPRASVKLSVPSFNARELLKRLGQEVPVTADPNALTAVGLEAQLDWANEVATLSGLQVRLDDTTLKGQAKVGPFDPLTGSAKLTVDKINLDRYLPPPAAEAVTGDGAPAPQPAPEPGAEPAGELPLEALRKLRIDAVLQIGSLVLKNMTLTELQVHLKANDGLIRLNPMTARLYEGQYSGDIQLDARRDDARISVDERLTGVQSDPLLTDLLGESKLSGVANVNFKAAMVGGGMDEWLSSVDGQGRFEFLNGAIKDFNLAQLIRQAKAKLKGKEAVDDGARGTDFTSVTGNLVIENGLVTNPDLDAQSPLFRVDGKGTANLVSQAIDYLLTVNIVDTTKGQGGKELEDLKKIPIPLRIGGSFSEPTFKVDLAEALRQSAGGRIEAEQEKLESKAEEEVERNRKKLESEAKDRLNRLLKR